jgi:hypothetical protein
LLIAFGLLLAFIGQMNWALAGTSGGIAGTIRDAQTGQPIPGAQVRISSQSQVANATTDEHGHFIVFSLQPDDYTLTVAKEGYAPQVVTGYSVYADQTQRFDETLTRSAADSTSTAPPPMR